MYSFVDNAVVWILFFSQLLIGQSEYVNLTSPAAAALATTQRQPPKPPPPVNTRASEAGLVKEQPALLTSPVRTGVEPCMCLHVLTKMEKCFLCYLLTKTPESYCFGKLNRIASVVTEIINQ